MCMLRPSPSSPPPSPSKVGPRRPPARRHSLLHIRETPTSSRTVVAREVAKAARAFFQHRQLVPVAQPLFSTGAPPACGPPSKTPGLGPFKCGPVRGRRLHNSSMLSWRSTSLLAPTASSRSFTLLRPPSPHTRHCWPTKPSSTSMALYKDREAPHCSTTCKLAPCREVFPRLPTASWDTRPLHLGTLNPLPQPSTPCP